MSEKEPVNINESQMPGYKRTESGIYVPESVLSGEKNKKEGGAGKDIGGENKETEQTFQEIGQSQEKELTIRKMMEADRPVEKPSAKPEEEERFKLNESALRALGGSIEGKWDKLLLDKARATLEKNAESFLLTPKAVKGLSDAELRRMVKEKSRLREMVVESDEDGKLTRLHYLGEIYREAKKRGGLDPSEKILFFKTLEEFLDVNDNRELLRDVRVGLWESMMGKNIEEEAAERFDQGGKEEYVNKKMGIYKRKASWLIMSEDERKEIIDGSKSQVDREVEKEINEKNRRRKKRGVEEMSEEEKNEIRKEKEKKIGAQWEKKIESLIIDKREAVETNLGRTITVQEIIFLKEKKGIDLAEIRVSGLFKKMFELKGGEKMNKSELNKFLKEKLVDGKNHFAEKEKEFGNEWTEEINKTKNEIIAEFLDETSTDLIEKIYEEKKKKKITNVDETATSEQQERARKIVQDLGPVADLLNQFIGEIGKGDMNPDEFLKKADALLGEGPVNRMMGEKGSEKRKEIEKKLAEKGGGPLGFLILLLGFVFIFSIIKFGQQYEQGGKK